MPRKKKVNVLTCTHKSCNPKFDSAACKNKSPAWVRVHFPRFYGKCPDCGERVIVYHSFEQFVAGDY